MRTRKGRTSLQGRRPNIRSAAEARHHLYFSTMPRSRRPYPPIGNEPERLSQGDNSQGTPTSLDDLPPVIDVHALSALMSVSENTLYELLKRGELGDLGVRIGTRYRFSREKVRRFLEGDLS